MQKLNLVENWLNTVAYSHSNSQQTRAMYAGNLQRFLGFIGMTAERVCREYDRLSERKFKHKYAQYIMAFISELQKKDYAPATVTASIHAIRSFFKYSDLPLGFVPSGSNLVIFHNKDIQHREILQILQVSSPREKAFYTMMAQSGLRPCSLTALRLRDVDGILDDKTPVPCKITVKIENTKGKYGEYFTFMGSESIQYVKDYLKTRSKELTPESYLFTMQGKEQPVDPAIFSHLFNKTVKRLRENKILDFQTTKKEIYVESRTHKHLRSYISRSEVRLYNLRKFFRKYAGQAGLDYVNYWMGHLSSQGSDLHYMTKDVEHHREVYAEKAMPFLRLGTATPSESERQIEDLRQELSHRDEEIRSLRDDVGKLKPLLSYLGSLNSDERLRVDLMDIETKEGTTKMTGVFLSKARGKPDSIVGKKHELTVTKHSIEKKSKKES